MVAQVRPRPAKNRLKEAIAKKGLAQEEAARRVGVSYRHFNRVVLGHAEPTLLVAQKMAAVLDAPCCTTCEILIQNMKPRVDAS